MIKNIEISRIRPHYNNPRKELGDLTELAESIKKTGILQNLTVVPWFSNITKSGADDPVKQEEMGYIAVIGHRRLAAAKLAGLKEVPCVISDMSYRADFPIAFTNFCSAATLFIRGSGTGTWYGDNANVTLTGLSCITPDYVLNGNFIVIGV